MIRIAIVYGSTLDCSLTLARAKSALFSTVRDKPNCKSSSFYFVTYIILDCRAWTAKDPIAKTTSESHCDFTNFFGKSSMVETFVFPISTTSIYGKQL